MFPMFILHYSKKDTVGINGTFFILHSAVQNRFSQPSLGLRTSSRRLLQHFNLIFQMIEKDNSK